LSSIVALGAFGLGAGPLATVCIFLALYNVGHLLLRAWGLRVGLAHGVRVAPALATPVLRQGPQAIARFGAFAAGIALPLALHRMLGSEPVVVGAVAIGAVVGAFLLTSIHKRAQGWRIALGALVIFVLYSVIR
jgi:PTS system mannose-specific IID component